MLRHEPFEIGDRLLVPAEPQAGFESALDALQPELVQPPGLVTREELPAESGEGLSPPEGKGSREEGAGQPIVLLGERSAAVCEQVLEAISVELSQLDNE